MESKAFASAFSGRASWLLCVLGLGCQAAEPASPGDAALDVVQPKDISHVSDTSMSVDLERLDATPSPDAEVDASGLDQFSLLDAPDAPAGCASDAACVGSLEGPVCDTATRRCVACTPRSDRCPAGQYCVTGLNRCENGCRDDAACAAQRCDPTTHTCVACLRDEHCAVGSLCVANACVPGCSSARPCPAAQSCCEGACIDTLTNAARCGGCDVRCAFPNAMAVCRGGVCHLGSCVAPFASCDGIDENGCETDLRVSMSFCGSCGSPCAARPNTRGTCELGVCRYICTGGYGDCDGNLANGCETDLATAPDHCGMCGRACALPNATANCNLGACTVASCAVGFGDCNTHPADGCEVDLRESLSHCGGCGRRCAPPNAYPTCTAGTCRLYGCDVGYGDCDRSAANGCEVNVTTTANCSACGLSCPPPTGPHTVARCNPTGGTFVCGIACEAGWLDCDANLANGCEATGSCTVDRELFYDGFEAGTSRWSLDPVWREDGISFYLPCSGSRQLIAENMVFNPCVYGGYATLIAPIDISRASTLTLTHQSRSGLGRFDALTIEGSSDGGRTWTVIANEHGTACGVRSIDMSSFVGRSTLRLRFAYSSGACDGAIWYLDEVRLRGLVRNY